MSLFTFKTILSIIAILQVVDYSLSDELIKYLKEDKPKSKVSLSSDNKALLAETKLGLCDFSNCPLGKGTCFENSCVCSIGYTSLKNDKSYCEYEEKEHTIAFFLEFFLPFGAGHFYSARYLSGTIKLVLFAMLCLFWCGDICNLRIRFTLNSRWDKIHISLVLINLIAFTCMHLLDLVCFGFSIYLDGNGVDML